MGRKKKDDPYRSKIVYSRLTDETFASARKFADERKITVSALLSLALEVYLLAEKNLENA